MIRRLLVADRGAAARRVFATCRQTGIETVAVYSDPDADAPHVREADWAVHLPGNAATATYLRGDRLVGAARRAGADAVHPGWGRLAADPDFAASVADHGLLWVGTPAKILAAVADRRTVAERLAVAGLPVPPRYRDPCRAEEFPVPVDPAQVTAGPVRLARDRGELTGAVATRREAPSGDDDVYCEQHLGPGRRLDVPVLVDGRGNPLAFGERECSVQRRRDPLLTESPSPVVTPRLREELARLAVEAVGALGYVGLATVRVLLGGDGRYHLLGVAPGLDAGHAVTECATGYDLVRLQLLVAEGAPLPVTGVAATRGHSVTVDLRAEDPADGWRPATGRLHRFRIGPVRGGFGPLPAPGLRLDAAVAPTSPVTGLYDSTLATVTVSAPTRFEAARLLALALRRAHLHGVTTNRDLLVRVLRHPAFLAGATDTGFLDGHPEVFAPLLSSVEMGRLACLAAALAAARARRSDAPVLGSLPAGWRNVPFGAQTVVYSGPTGTVEVGYRLDRDGELTGWWVRTVDPDDLDLAGLGQPLAHPPEHPPVAVEYAGPEQVVLDVAGMRLAFAIHRVGELSYVDSPDGSVALTELPRYQAPAPPDDHPG